MKKKKPKRQWEVQLAVAGYKWVTIEADTEEEALAGCEDEENWVSEGESSEWFEGAIEWQEVRD